MRLVITERCTGHGRCYSIASGLAEPDDSGNGRVIGDGFVPRELEEDARTAVLSCPEGAVELSQ